VVGTAAFDLQGLDGVREQQPGPALVLAAPQRAVVHAEVLGGLGAVEQVFRVLGGADWPRGSSRPSRAAAAGARSTGRVRLPGHHRPYLGRRRLVSAGVVVAPGRVLVVERHADERRLSGTGDRPYGLVAHPGTDR
jgi:hypothetical protein